MGPAARPSAKVRRAGELIRIGSVTGIHGLKGALRVRTDDPASTTLATLAHVYLEIGGETREYRMLSASRVGRGQTRIVLEGIDRADVAEALKGAIVLAAIGDLPKLKPGEFYYFQVLGMEVRLVDGRILGRIEDVFSTGANEVWVVRDGGREVLIPVIEDVVKAIDFNQRRATIEPLPGLLD